MRASSFSVSSQHATAAFLCCVINNTIHLINLLISLSRVLYRLCCAYKCPSVHAIVAGNREETMRRQLWLVTANFCGIKNEYKDNMVNYIHFTAHATFTLGQGVAPGSRLQAFAFDDSVQLVRLRAAEDNLGANVCGVGHVFDSAKWYGQYGSAVDICQGLRLSTCVAEVT